MTRSPIRAGLRSLLAPSAGGARFRARTDLAGAIRSVAGVRGNQGWNPSPNGSAIDARLVAASRIFIPLASSTYSRLAV
jgi:hypothetical protein